VVVRPARWADDGPRCAAIVRGLPDYFTDNVPAEVERDGAAHPAWVVEAGIGVIGFAIVERRSDSVAEVLWIAVDAVHRGRGAGLRLLGHVLTELSRDGVRVVEAKTLAPTSDYAPYVATRAFWQRMGFIHLDTVDPYPGWKPGNPCAIYVAPL
jgi:GNAT superfamily N-acetyltransferase